MSKYNYYAKLYLHGDLAPLKPLIQELPGEHSDPTAGSVHSIVLCNGPGNALFEQLWEVSEALAQHHRPLFAALRAAGGRAECLVSWEIPRFNGGLLATQCMGYLAELEIAVTFKMIETLFSLAPQPGEGPDEDALP